MMRGTDTEVMVAMRRWLAGLVMSWAAGVAWGEAAAPVGVAAAPPVRMEGIGNAEIAITTANPEARVWFEQGLNLLHDFWDYEAVRAFGESVRLDPQCAMCWWGLSQAQSFREGPTDASRASMERAKRLRKRASPPERLYIEASLEEIKEEAKSSKSKAGDAAKTEEDEDRRWRESKATKKLRRLAAMRPDEAEAKVYLAESLLDGRHKDGTPKPGTVEGQAILREVLASHPDDSAANHYWIHAVEAGPHPEWALGSARRLAELAPASGHMVHMPGHIFYRTGDYAAAQVSFEHSMRVDEAYMRTQGVPVDDDWNYVHNLMYLIADLVEEGKVQEATEVSAKLNAARGSTDATLYRFSTRDGLTRLDVALPVALRGGDWTTAAAMLERSKPEAAWVNLVWLRGALLAYVRGMAALEAGDTAGAAKQQAALDAATKAQPGAGGMEGHPMPAMAGGAAKDMMREPARSFIDVAATELRGSVLMAEDKAAEADAAFAKAAELEAALGYREPPYYIRPVGETRGDALMRAGRYREAKAAYEAALEERPRSGYPLYGIARAEAAMGDDAGARATYARMLEAWIGADAGLPQAVAARAWERAHAGAVAAGLR